MIKWNYEKNEKIVAHTLASKRRCLGYSKVYSKVILQKKGC